MAVFKCKMCGGALEINDETVATCEYCGTQQTLPKLDDDKRANLYDRANHFRRNNDFDKAMGIYEQILNEDNTDAEAYWSIVLCRYGIEYVEDPSSHKRVPTVNRAQFTSIFDDDNYKSALQYADGYQRHLYEEEAKAINEIQKGILAISQKEEPFDVFICYKESDNGGRRTPDSVLAQDLYYQLTQEGFKVFFARITLEDKLGSAYEPYIFAALNSAKVMVVLGTKPEFFNAVWVKNEWSRYLALIKQGQRKILIPAYKDMDPYDLPEEFSHLQAQDMTKLGFMQDLIRGIKKIVSNGETKTTIVKETVVAGVNTNIDPLLKRAYMFLNDGVWDKAVEYCEKVLDVDPENARAYVGLLLAQLKIRSENTLVDSNEAFSQNDYFKKALQFADENYKNTLLDLNKENIYRRAKKAFTSAKTEDEYKSAKTIFVSIKGYKDSDELTQKCIEKAEAARIDTIYQDGKFNYNKGTIAGCQAAITSFNKIVDYKDSKELIKKSNEMIARLEKEAATARKTKIIAILVIIGIVIAIIIASVSSTISNNNKIAAEIYANFAGKTFKDLETFEVGDYYSRYDHGCINYDDEKYEFKANGEVVFTEVYEWRYNSKWIQEVDPTDKNSSETTTETYTYTVEVSFSGEITLKVDYKTFFVEVDENNVPISITYDGYGNRKYD